LTWGKSQRNKKNSCCYIRGKRGGKRVLAKKKKLKEGGNPNVVKNLGEGEDGLTKEEGSIFVL